MLQKAMPKQVKGGGIIPPPRVLAIRRQKVRRSGKFLPLRRFPSLPFARLPHAGNPRWLFVNVLIIVKMLCIIHRVTGVSRAINF